MDEETKKDDTPMESTQENAAQTTNENEIEQEADETEMKKDTNDQLKDDKPPSDTINDADDDDMPPPKPQEPTVEHTEPTETKEELKEADKDAVMEETEEGSAEKSTETITGSPAAVKLPPRPIKKARTAYFIFADEKRAEIAARHPGEGVGAVAKETGQMWSALTDEEKAPYHQQSAAEKERVAAELAKYKDLPDSAISPTKPAAINTLQLPSARIRKICKLDPDVKGISKEALLLITKSAELVTGKLGMETVKVAALQNRRKLVPQDIAQVCSAREQFLFLKEDVRDLQHELHQQALSNKQAKKQSDTKAATTTNGKPLTDYFSAKQQQ